MKSRISICKSCAVEENVIPEGLVSSESIQSSHKALLEERIALLENQEREFYVRSAQWNYRAWHIAAGVAFFSSVSTALVAAIAAGDGRMTISRVALIIIPVMGATATGLLHLYKFQEKEALRQRGRIENEDLIAYAKSLKASATCEEQFRAAFDAVRERHKQLELAQHREDAEFRSIEGPRVA